MCGWGHLLKHLMSLMNIQMEWRTQILIVQLLQILEFHLLILIILWHSRQIMGKLCQLKCLAEEVGAHSNKVIKDIVKVAKEKGINEGNSLYYYSNATFYEENPGKLYND